VTYFVVNLNCSCEAAVRLTTSALERQGLRVARNFDLRDALSFEGVLYPCPNHGTQACTCNYVVLSVYQAADSDRPVRPPNQIVLHDREGHTRLSLPAGAGAQGEPEDNTDTDPRLLRALAELLNETAAQPESQAHGTNQHRESIERKRQ